MTTFTACDLPDIDQRKIKRGDCPWCLGDLTPGHVGNCCLDCGSEFIGQLSTEDEK